MPKSKKKAGRRPLPDLGTAEWLWRACGDGEDFHDDSGEENEQEEDQLEESINDDFNFELNFPELHRDDRIDRYLLEIEKERPESKLKSVKEGFAGFQNAKTSKMRSETTR